MIALAEDLARLKRQILELLEKDREFRHAVVGMLKLDRVLRGLRRHDRKLEKLLESLNKHEAELVKLREDFNKVVVEMARLREDMNAGFKRHDEVLERHAQELAKLREDMNAGFRRHDEELAKLREDFNKMLSAIVQIQEEQRKLREGYERLEERVGSLERGLKGLEGGMLKGFADMSKFAGVNFEDFARSFLTEFLRRSGVIPEGAEIKKTVIDGEEINIFLEDPLIVGEVTAYADSVDEIMKLLRKAELVKSKYSREPRKMMVALNVKRGVVKEIERIAKERGVELMVGRAVD